MKKLILPLFIVCFLAKPAFAFDEWSKTDITLQSTFTALMVVDWLQSRYIAKHPPVNGFVYSNNSVEYKRIGGYIDTNPFLSSSPSVLTVDLYFAAATILHAGISHVLPKETDLFGLTIYPRTMWQTTWIGIETSQITINYKLGVKIEF